MAYLEAEFQQADVTDAVNPIPADPQVFAEPVLMLVDWQERVTADRYSAPDTSSMVAVF